MTAAAEDWIKRLDMSPAIVGGWFAPALVSNEDIAGSALPPRFGVDHPLYSSNWYLLQAGEFLQLHALKQDELWFFHVGTPIRLHTFSRELGHQDFGYSEAVLGSDPEAGETLQAVALNSTWFGAELAGPGFALVSCSLSPGYERSDSAKPTARDIESLVLRFPGHAELILRLAAV